MARSIIIILFLLFLAFTSCGDTGDDSLSIEGDAGNSSLSIEGDTGDSSLSIEGDTGDGSLSIESVSLSWDPSPNEEVIGYKVYIGRASGNYYRIDDVGNALTYTVKNLEPGTYYFVCTAYDASGNESKYSNEVRTSR